MIKTPIDFEANVKGIVRSAFSEIERKLTQEPLGPVLTALIAKQADVSEICVRSWLYSRSHDAQLEDAYRKVVLRELLEPVLEHMFPGEGEYAVTVLKEHGIVESGR